MVSFGTLKAYNGTLNIFFELAPSSKKRILIFSRLWQLGAVNLRDYLGNNSAAYITLSFKVCTFNLIIESVNTILILYFCT